MSLRDAYECARWLAADVASAAAIAVTSEIVHTASTRRIDAKGCPAADRPDTLDPRLPDGASCRASDRDDEEEAA